MSQPLGLGFEGLRVLGLGALGLGFLGNASVSWKERMIVPWEGSIRGQCDQPYTNILLVLSREHEKTIPVYYIPIFPTQEGSSWLH